MSDKEIKNATKMEIINSEAHHRANIKFDGKPSEEVRKMMKNEGWLYSSKNNVWYPKNEAAFNSFEFAKQLQKDFFPEQKNEPEIVTKDSERQELINLISSKASLDTVISKLEELYGAKVVINATQKAVKNIENKAEIKAFCKELADKMIQTAYEASASGFNYYLSMEEVSRISGKDEAWLKAHMDNIQEALNEHWDNELLESEFDSNENSFNLSFYSIGHDANELFKKDENGRWVRKTDQELIQEGLLIKDDVFENQNPVDQIPTITKFNNIIQEAFFTLTDDDKENSITQEGKEKNYNMWYKAVCSNIMNEIQNGHAEICRLVDNFNFEDFNKNPNYSKSGKKYFVKQELLVKCHEIIQDNKRKEFYENKTPYIELNWSESPVFPFENTVYSIKEFNDIIQNADKENRNRKDYAEKKYGSIESYWALEEADQLPEEDKDIEFGYYKTKFNIVNLPNPENPEDLINYGPTRYDIGDGNGSIFDFIRSTCTYEDVISAMNDIEQKIYQPDISEEDKKLIDSIFEKEKLNLNENLENSMKALDEAQNNYNELHKSWIIEVNAAEKADNDLQEALNSVKETYEASIVNAYKEYYKSIELKNFSFEIPINIKKEQTFEYLSNKANQMLVTSLYSDSKTYETGKFDWSKQMKIWEQFPFNCNKREYTDTLLESTFASMGLTVNTSVEKTPAESLTEEEIKQGKSEANRIRQENLRKKLEAEQGKNYDRNLSTTDIAKKLREYVKKNYPDYKFSIRSKYFSGGSEINVELMKSPVPITDYDSMKEWFDENAVRAGSHYSRWDDEQKKDIYYLDMTDEQKKDFIKYYVESGRTFNISRHNFNDKFNLWMTPDVRKVMSDVVSQLESYNYDHSDSMTDYFDVNFYSDYDISKEAMTHSLELLKSRENVEEINNSEELAELDKQAEEMERANGVQEMNEEISGTVKKPFNFFINDIVNLDLGIGAEIEPIINLSAEEAVKKYQELITDGYRVYIGINIPGDLVFDDKEGLGAAILCKTDGKPSFYIGDNFVKELKRNDEHSQNVISAYKELYEAAAKLIPETEYPDFVFEKEKQLNELNNSEELIEPLRVYSYSSFGFEGSIVNVETDLRRGIPAFDIVGLADGAVKESRERVLSAFRNSNLELPSERILLSCSPADLRKDSPMDAAIATSILARKNNYTGKDVLVLGEIELSGKIRPVRGAYAAVKTAMEAGIERIVCDPETAKIIKDIDGIEILEVNDLNDIADKINNFELFKKTEVLQKNNENIVEFNEERLAEEEIKNLEQAMDGHFETVRAMEIAIAGKHNFLTTGAPGSGKTLLTQHLFPALTPKLTEKEAQITQRINSIAGLDSPNRDNSIPPFRMPHQTASIEGICGGGMHCHPGEISLAHNGTLFLDEAAEFRSSVLQMMRVPLESKAITLSRAGRTTVYPANFQLVMATNPCPCGNYGAKDKICLDSARSIEQYWKKFAGPLLDRIEIVNYCEKDVNDHRKISLEQMKEAIRKAYEIQRKRGVYNRELRPDEIQKYCQLDEESKNWFEKQNQKQGEISPRTINNILKTSLTIANMEGRENIQLKDLQESYGLCIKSQDMEYPVMHNQKYVTLTQEDIDRKHGITENNVSINSENKQPELDFDDPGLNQNIISQALDEQKKILEPILNGERTGMYDCFKDFEEHGVFDIKGAKVNLGKDGKITPTGWKQLQAAMEIYRNKKFETFRYVLIDQNTGEIKDQMAISSHLPSRCRIIIDDDTKKQVISKAHNNNCIIAICHNHPSGNIEPSKYDIKATNELDKSFRQTNGFNRFAGHIILDHNNFSLAVPNQSNPGHCRWSTKEAINQTEYDPMVNQVYSSPEHDLINKVISTQKCLQNIAVMVNDTFNWNDNYIPVAFTTSNKISGIQYYSKEFFENEPEKVKEVMLKTAMENGASRTFPIITNAFTNKLSAEKQKAFENVMLNHIKNDVFSDVAIYDTTICTKHEIEPGDSYDGIYDIEADKTPDFQSTWKPEVDSSLFPPHDFVNEKTPGYELITAVKVPEKEESTIFKHDFMMQHNFYPPMTKKDGNYIIRCKQSDLVYNNDGIEKNETLNLEISKEKLAESIAAHKLFEKTKRLNFSSNSIISNPEPLLCNATVIKGKTIIASPSAEQKALIMENFPELKGNNQAIKDEYKKIAGPLAEEVFKIEPSIDYKNPDISKNQEQNQNNDFGY